MEIGDVGQQPQRPPEQVGPMVRPPAEISNPLVQKIRQVNHSRQDDQRFLTGGGRHGRDDA